MESYYTFLQKHNHLSKGLLYIYMYEKFPEYKNLNNAILFHKDCCVCLEGYFLKRMPHTCESYLRKTINIFRKYHIGNCVVLISCYIFPNECGSFFEGRMPNTIVQANTFHEIIKYFVKGMPHSWKKCVSSNYIFKTCYPYLKQHHLYGKHTISVPKYIYMEDMVHSFYIKGSSDSLYQRNVALSVEECCMEVRRNFLKECRSLLNDDGWDARCRP
jgi:hypothetical protein